MNKLIYLIILSVFLSFSCKKETFNHQAISYSYADSVAGIYHGIAYHHSLNYYDSTANTSDTIDAHVTDLRTDKSCLFNIDIINATDYLSPDGYFGNQSVLRHRRFFKDSLVIIYKMEILSGYFTSYEFYGKKQ